MLPFDFPLIKEAKIQYGNLALGELLTIPLGVVLWLVGFQWLRAGSRLKRAVGVGLLVMAVIYTLGWLGINGLVLGAGLGLL
jgi:hypothetical protein